MELVLLGLVVLLAAANLVVVLLCLPGRAGPGFGPELAALEKGVDRVERAVRDEIAGNRTEAGAAARELRGEVQGTLNTLASSLLKRMADAALVQQGQLDTYAQTMEASRRAGEAGLDKVRQTVDRKLTEVQADARTVAAADREAAGKSQAASADQLAGRLAEAALAQATQLDLFSANLTGIARRIDGQLEQVRETVERQLSSIQADNAKQLDQMRATVDEKLHATLETRLGESFRQVSERLEAVHKGLGEMQTLAHGVGDLKKVLTNIKTRGNWGEVQLGNLLEQMLTPDQYGVNVACNPATADRVEFAIKLPGRENAGEPVWLPVDAKFPQEDYQRLIDAADVGDVEGITRWSDALESRVVGEARKVREKYVSVPHTTDFAILFLPTEGLFAEVLRRPGLSERVLQSHRVVLAGPTTLAALVNSLQIGFRSLVLEKQSAEIGKTLGAFKTEFVKFGDVLAKVKKKLQEATNTVDAAEVRQRAVNRTLKQVVELPTATVAALVEVEAVVGLPYADED